MDSVGVYVHVPFCERICPYCDFPVVAARTLPAAQESRYVDALLAELDLRRGRFAQLALQSIYLGGGTPALLRPASVARIVGAVRAAFAADPAGAEVTLEANPSTLERERLPGFRDAGVGRLSIGIQSFGDLTLKRLGRAHRGEEGLTTLRAARAAGFDNLSLDLIYGVPDQDSASLQRDLEQALAFAPEHVSAYALTVEAGTPYERAVERGQLQLPGGDVAAERTEQVWDALEGGGLAQYELSSFGRAGFEAVHNRRYWERRPVLGLGMGAWSLEPSGPDAPFGVRRSNPRTLAPYLDALESGRVVDAAPPEVLALETARFEASFLALRTRAGLGAAAFEREFGDSPAALYGATLDELAGGGLLEASPAGDLRLTRSGRLLADSVFVRLLQAPGLTRRTPAGIQHRADL